MFPWINKFLFRGNNFFAAFNKMGKLQLSALYLSKCFCLEYAQSENSLKEYYQSIDYAINQTISICRTLIGY